MISINLTIHNKENILKEVLDGIFHNTVSKFELICVLDGCTDNSEKILLEYLYNNKNKNLIHFNVLYAPNVFETKANNLAMKASTQEYICIIQDDQIINSYAWDEKIMMPFKAFSDVFSVTGRASHNYYINENSRFLNSPTDDIGEWSDIVLPCDIADKTNSPKDTFQIRSTCNRGPLCINHQDLQKMNYLDEIYSPQDLCDHDLHYRMRKKLGKVCGFFEIGWWSKPEYGGTRDEKGNTKRWCFATNQKNSKILLERHKEAINNRIIETRILK